ncbi:hypothetical protein Q7A53_00765 [Halobacillus rhizosphaerae]
MKRILCGLFLVLLFVAGNSHSSPLSTDHIDFAGGTVQHSYDPGDPGMG